MELRKFFFVGVEKIFRTRFSSLQGRGGRVAILRGGGNPSL